MKCKLFMILALFTAVLIGCTNTAAVMEPDLASTPALTVRAETAGISEIDINSPVMTEEIVPDNIRFHTTQSITISAVGDILPFDNCLASVKNGDVYDFDPPFSEVMPVIQSADLAIGNLETTISGASAKYTGYPRFNAPDTLLDTLKKSGFDVLITSNNHCLDRGTAGLVRTIDQLDLRGFLHTGTYKTEEDSKKILVTEVKGIKIAVLAYSYGTNGQRREKPYMVNLLKMDKMLNDVKKAKELKPDVIIAYLHMGDEGIQQPNSEQKNTVDRLMKAGVDIVLGDHPHVIQPMERKTITDAAGRERDGFVIYSLGNFMTGEKGQYRDLGLILNIEIQKDMLTGKITIKKTQPIPTWIQFYSNNGHDSYRIMPISLAVEEYERKQGSHITADEYAYLKDTLSEMLEHVKKGPE